MGFIYHFLENIFQHLSTAGYPCLFRAVTKIYCPGCGGTRAVSLLLTGHPVLSFLYHPIVLYTVFACIYIGVRFAIDALIPPVGRKPFRLTPVWLWVALAILLVNWGVKNFFLLALHIDLLAFPWG